MTDKFTFRVNSDASGESTPITSKAAFGDGYEQEAPFGLNPRKQRWTNTFSGYRPQARALVEFIESHTGQAVLWTPPLGVEGYYKIRNHQVSPQGGNYFLVTMEFEQVHAP